MEKGVGKCYTYITNFHIVTNGIARHIYYDITYVLSIHKNLF